MAGQGDIKTRFAWKVFQLLGRYEKIEAVVLVMALRDNVFAGLIPNQTNEAIAF